MNSNVLSLTVQSMSEISIAVGSRSLLNSKLWHYLYNFKVSTQRIRNNFYS